MKYQTLSLVAGTQICNAKCPFCVSRMTDAGSLDVKLEPINNRNLKKALCLAKIGNTSTVIITSKGEPTLYPEHITHYLEQLQEQACFPLIELQTNGSILEMDTYKGQNVEELLKKWYDLGLTTVLISNVGYDPELNHQIYFPHKSAWINIQKVVDKIQKVGLNVRLTTVGIDGGVDDPEKLIKLIQWAQFLGVKQLTWRPVNKPKNDNKDGDVFGWVKDRGLSQDQVNGIHEFVKRNGTLLYKLVHGAAVYDVDGMNLCLSNCLTQNPDEETIRQLIFFPNGDLYSDWEFKGSVIL